MIETLKNWFGGLSQRERILVSVAAMLTCGAIAVFALALPLLSAIEVRQQDYLSALERRGRIESRISGAGKAQAAQLASDSPLQTVISQSAAEAGFVLDRADAHGDTEVDIAMARAKPQALMSWLGDWENRGITVEHIDIKVANDGTVSLAAALSRPAR